jgi:hypothetical protein
MTRAEKNIVMFLFNNIFLFDEIDAPFSVSKLLIEYNKNKRWYKFQIPITEAKIKEICHNLITKYGILKRCDHPDNKNKDPYHLDRLYLTQELRLHGNRIELQKYGFWITLFNVLASIVTILSFLKND